LTENQRVGILFRDSFCADDCDREDAMNLKAFLLALVDEGYQRKTWHGPNLKQSLKGLVAEQASWRPGPGCHNIWEYTVHAAYWKYAVRRKIEGGKRGSFELTGSNFFERPMKGKLSEKQWKEDRDLLDRQHLALRKSIAAAKLSGISPKLVRAIYGVAFHDVYHAGQIRMLRRLMKGPSKN
jgi:hypothetical protein